MEKNNSSIKLKLAIAIVAFALSMFFMGFFLSHNAYASTLTSLGMSEENIDVEMNKILDAYPTYTYYILFRLGFPDNTYFHCLQISETPITVKSEESNNRLRLDGNTLTFIDYQQTKFIRDSGNDSNDHVVSNDQARWDALLRSSHTINYLDGTVFFSQLKLEKVVQPQHLSPVLSQMMVMIPVGLTLIIGFLGLRKGLALLRGILHQA